MRRLLVLVVVAGCSPASDPSPDAAPQPPGELDPAQSTSDLEYCVALTNRWRATVALRPLRRSELLERYAAEGAAADAVAGMAHHHIKTTPFPGMYTTLAENELLAGPLARYGSVRAVMEEGIAAMWAEGPSGAHYQTIVGPFTELGCGVAVLDGAVTVTQDFRAL